MYSKMVLLFQDGSHVESYEGAGRIMHAKWNHSSNKVYSYKDKYLCMYYNQSFCFAELVVKHVSPPFSVSN